MRKRHDFTGLIVRALTAGVFLAYLVVVSPHLVHHLFDDDHAGPPCPHLLQSQQTPGIEAASLVFSPPGEAAPVDPVLTGSSCVSPDLVVIHSRAPPRSLLTV